MITFLFRFTTFTLTFIIINSSALFASQRSLVEICEQPFTNLRPTQFKLEVLTQCEEIEKIFSIMVESELNQDLVKATVVAITPAIK